MIEARCPSRDVLLRYLQGNFDLSEADSLEEHLEQCPACEETVAELEDTNDTLMRHLPLAAGASVEADAEAPAWIERLKGGPPAEKDGESVVDEQREGVGTQWNEGLASYELLEVLGKGGMGVVYRGRHRQLGRPVAVKVVRPKLVSAAEAHRRFDREIRILGRLNHPGIVMATDAGRVGSAAYLVMELIDGVDLARLVRSGGPLDVGEACEVARQIAVALSAAHAAGAVHRDVKPSNAMIDTGGRVKLLDFGLASLIDLGDEHGETSLGRLVGTLDYMAPEQAEGKGVQAAADLYGLGATLFYLLAGRPPHATGNNRTLLGQLKALSSEDAPHLADLRLDVPEELSDLVAELLARNPADRPATAAEVADRLAAWANPGAKMTLAGMIPTVDRTDDVPAAARSLAELVGGEQEVVASPSIEKVETAASGNGRRVGRWLLGLAGFAAAALLGIVLLVDTPEGTLRIESDAENVEIELIDEADRTKTVQIEEGENATQLRAGKYRIRLAGKHDNLSLTPGAIELRRGEERVARITHVPPEAPEKQLAGGMPRADEPSLQSINEELTHVTISVEYENGRPAIGAEVRMSNGDPERPVIVTGKADENGVAFDRNLPYGKYTITIKVPDSDGAHWTDSLNDVLLEFGGTYEQTVVAPVPLERATVQVHSSFLPGGLDGLRFGSFGYRGGQFAAGITYSPEPGKLNPRLANFPVPGNGIKSIALYMRMGVTRGTKQPSGKVFDWHWMRQEDLYGIDLMLTDTSVGTIAPEAWGGNVAFDIRDSQYFFVKRYATPGIQYFTFPGRPRTNNPLTLKLPPGTLMCDVRSLFGKADEEVIKALGLKPEAGREVWLEAKLNNESAWVPRAIDVTDWTHGKESRDPGNVLVFKTLTLEPGGTHEIRVTSPDPSSLEEIEEESGAESEVE